MWMNGSSSFRSTPANARLTGNPRPSRADGALVIDTTGRCMPFGGSAGTGGSTVRSGTVKAGTADSLGRFVFNDPWETPTADNTFPDSCPADRHTASGGFDHRDGVALVDHVALVDRHLGDDTGDLGRHGDLHLHGLQDDERVVGFDDVTGTGHDLPDAGDHFRHDHVTHACSLVPVVRDVASCRARCVAPKPTQGEKQAPPATSASRWTQQGHRGSSAASGSSSTQRE